MKSIYLYLEHLLLIVHYFRLSFVLWAQRVTTNDNNDNYKTNRGKMNI